ncbi:MAG: transglutaminase domain-containing protein [Euryarchaeota archaeon]|nr:transglutaminase domain-containing protein [Euryarchaeota archaeon]
MPTGRKTIVPKVIVVIVVLGVIALLVLTPLGQSLIKALLSPFQESYPESISFSLERTLTIDPNGGTILNFTVDVSRPQDMSEGDREMQDIEYVRYSPLYDSLDNRYGGLWVVWEGGRLDGDETYSIQIRYDVKATTQIWNYDESDVLNITDIPDHLRARYVKDEWKILVSEPSIESRAEAIVGDETNVLAIIESIYDWITANVRYPTFSTDSDPQTSVETLQSRVGDCDDQAILFSALARAVGVPAWLQIGALYNEVENAWGGHGWVQTYLPLREGGGVNVTIDTVNRDFLIWKPNRFADFTSDGNSGHLMDYYYTFYCFYDPSSYPVGEGPGYEEQFVSVRYEESENRVGRDDFPSCVFPDFVVREYVPASSTSPCTVPAAVRR